MKEVALLYAEIKKFKKCLHRFVHTNLQFLRDREANLIELIPVSISLIYFLHKSDPFFA